MLMWARKAAGIKPGASISPHHGEPDFRIPPTNAGDEAVVRAGRGRTGESDQ